MKIWCDAIGSRNVYVIFGCKFSLVKESNERDWKERSVVGNFRSISSVSDGGERFERLAKVAVAAQAARPR